MAAVTMVRARQATAPASSTSGTTTTTRTTTTMMPAAVRRKRRGPAARGAVCSRGGGSRSGNVAGVGESVRQNAWLNRWNDAGYRARMRTAALTTDAAMSAEGTVVRGEIDVVMKFGGSSVADETCMRRVADIVLSSINSDSSRPCVVLSAMGDTTNALLTMGELACSGNEADGEEIDRILEGVKLRHTTAMAALGVDAATVEEVNGLLESVSQLLGGLRIVGEFSPRASDLLSSFGERMSTRIFAALLRRRGCAAEQLDSFAEGMFVSTDDFTNGDILDETYENVYRRLHGEGDAIPIVTGFLARGVGTGAITTLGRGGSDLSATVIGRALKLREVQVWKDVDGVLTTDPRIVSAARTVSELTFEEATELAYFGATVLHPQSMIPAMSSPAGPDALRVRVMNSHRQSFEGTLIGHETGGGSDDGGADCGNLTSIVLKRNVTMLEIVSTRMLGQYGFLRRVFGVFEANKISVDLVTTSEVSVCITLDPSKIWTRQLQQQELDRLVSDFEEFASVHMNSNLAILSLIGNWSRQPAVLLEKAFKSLGEEDIDVKLISKGEKPNVAIVVADDVAVLGLKCLHKTFFER